MEWKECDLYAHLLARRQLNIANQCSCWFWFDIYVKPLNVEILIEGAMIWFHQPPKSIIAMVSVYLNLNVLRWRGYVVKEVPASKIYMDPQVCGVGEIISKSCDYSLRHGELFQQSVLGTGTTSISKQNYNIQNPKGEIEKKGK